MMDAGNRLLVVIDPREPSDFVVQRAIELAQQFDADLELFASYHIHLGFSIEVLKSEIFHHAVFDPLGELESMLEKIAEPIRAYGIEVTVDVVCDAPLHEAIVRKVLRDKPRWVIKDAYHHGVLQELSFDNTDWNLIRECPCPLWLVRSSESVIKAPVLAAVDPLHTHDKPASLDKKIVSLSQFIAGQTKSDLHVFHSYDPTPAFMVTPGAESAGILGQSLSEQMQVIHNKALKELADSFSISEEKVHLELGSVKKNLYALIKELEVGLIVMGAVARNPFKRIFIGSTAEEVLQRLPCDVVIVKPEWFVTHLDSTPYVKDLDLIKDRKWGLKC